MPQATLEEIKKTFGISSQFMIDSLIMDGDLMGEEVTGRDSSRSTSGYLSFWPTSKYPIDDGEWRREDPEVVCSADTQCAGCTEVHRQAQSSDAQQGWPFSHSG